MHLTSHPHPYTHPTGNRLTALPPGLGSLSRLSHLDASDNDLRALPPSFSALTALTCLKLAANAGLGASQPCHSLAPSLPHLRHLDLAGTGLQGLPPGFGASCPGLTSLHLSSNDLREVSRVGQSVCILA